MSTNIFCNPCDSSVVVRVGFSAVKLHLTPLLLLFPSIQFPLERLPQSQVDHLQQQPPYLQKITVILRSVFTIDRRKTHLANEIDVEESGLTNRVKRHATNSRLARLEISFTRTHADDLRTVANLQLQNNLKGYKGEVLFRLSC